MNSFNKTDIKYYVLIPAYNEGDHIKVLIDHVKQHTSNILVVDDGSSDNTYEIVNGSNVECLRHTVNQGKGVSLSDGYCYLLNKNIDYLLTMDGDGQHSPDDIPEFIKQAELTGADIIVGNRMGYTKDMPLIRYLTNKFTSWVVSVLAGQKIPDSQCGFRLIHRRVLESVNVETKNFDAESEILIKASKQGFKIGSVNVKTIYGDELTKSKINPVRDTIRFFKLIYRVSKRK